MANICSHTVYIVANSDEDMKELLLKMSSNFENATNVKLVSTVSELRSWKDMIDAICQTSIGYNGLCLFSTEIDVGSEGLNIRGGLAYDKPYIVVSNGLKWGPSFQILPFCNALDKSRYGYAVINGGEYINIDADFGIAYIQWSNCPDDDYGPFAGPVDRAEFIELKNMALTKNSRLIEDLALRIMFDQEDESFYFWEVGNKELEDFERGSFSIKKQDEFGNAKYYDDFRRDIPNQNNNERMIPDEDSEDEDIPKSLIGLIFVHTGLDMDDEVKFQIVIEGLGGVIKSSTVLSTDYLVINPEYSGRPTTKYKRAKELQEKGNKVKIVTDKDFWSWPVVADYCKKTKLEDKSYISNC